MDDWNRHNSEGPGGTQGTFPEWCAQCGKAHARPSIVYYGTADEAWAPRTAT